VAAGGSPAAYKHSTAPPHAASNRSDRSNPWDGVWLPTARYARASTCGQVNPYRSSMAVIMPTP
jgi:hypothetical protein